ncbi:MAG: hypothetical protein SWC40_04635, partial [Thermodesulfobacteriota bacterium]|nr:hypothetical protein [Thermodesulfobacteriota bacterium]
QPGLGRCGVITVLFLCFAFTNSYIQPFLKNKKVRQHNKRNASFKEKNGKNFAFFPDACGKPPLQGCRRPVLKSSIPRP